MHLMDWAWSAFAVVFVAGVIVYFGRHLVLLERSRWIARREADKLRAETERQSA